MWCADSEETSRRGWKKKLENNNSHWRMSRGTRRPRSSRKERNADKRRERTKQENSSWRGFSSPLLCCCRTSAVECYMLCVRKKETFWKIVLRVKLVFIMCCVKVEWGRERAHFYVHSLWHWYFYCQHVLDGSQSIFEGIFIIWRCAKRRYHD